MIGKDQPGSSAASVVEETMSSLNVLNCYLEGSVAYLRGLGSEVLRNKGALDFLLAKMCLGAPGEDRLTQNALKISQRAPKLYGDLCQTIGICVVSIRLVDNWPYSIDFRKATATNLYQVIYAIYHTGLLNETQES